jgi:hypothetical protein
MMNDASAEVIAIRHATRKLRDAISAMTLTTDSQEQIRASLVELQTAINNLNTWLNDHKVL